MNSLRGILNKRTGSRHPWISAPLKAASSIGLVAAAVAVIDKLTMVGRTMLIRNPVAGYSSLLVVMLFPGGVLPLSPRITGEYVGGVSTSRSIIPSSALSPQFITARQPATAIW